jgi:hypothetical protein
MARVRADQQDLILVKCGQFMQHMRTLKQIATPSKMPILHRTALLEVDKILQKLVLTTTDLECGAQLEMPCVCNRNEDAVVCLEQDTITAMERHAELLGNPEHGISTLTFAQTTDRNQVKLGGIAFGVEDVDFGTWPEAWNFDGIGKESRSDAFAVSNAELLEAVRFALPSRFPDNTRGALHCIHLRREGKNGDSGWRAEATDGHRAALIRQRGSMVRDLLVHPYLAKAYQKLAPLVEEGAKGRILLQTFNEDVEKNKAGSLLMFARLKNGGIMQLVSRASNFGWDDGGAVKDFPPIDNVIPEKKTCLKFSGAVSALHQAAQAVIELSNAVKRKKDEAFPAEHAAFVIKDPGDTRTYLHHAPSNKRWILADSSESIGFGEESPNFRVAFNPHYLMGAANAFKRSDKFTAWMGQKGLEPLLLEDELDGKILVMPIRT